MRKNIVLLLMISIWSTLGFAQKDWAQFSKYAEANKQYLASSHKPKNPVVFLGNSITQGWAEQHPKFFSDNGFLGRGISGQTTYQFLVRFRPDVLNLQPKVVVINGGTNDVAENTHPYDEETTFSNLISMAETAEANGIKVIITSVLPAARFSWNPKIKNVTEKIQKLNARLKEYADSKGFIFVDYYTPMATKAGALNPAYTRDGVHPTSAGYDVMESLILPAINATLGK